MLINKYGILIKKKLQERYPEKYDELKESGKLFPIIRDSQYEIEQYRKNLINENRTFLTKSKMIEILDDINNSIDVTVEEIGNSKTASYPHLNIIHKFLVSSINFIPRKYARVFS